MSELIYYIDELLKTPERTSTYHPELIESGSTGKCLYGSFSKKPGLCGVFHYVHKTDIHDLLTYKLNGVANSICLKTETVWYPSHISMKHIYPSYEITEQKYITGDDTAVNHAVISCDSGKFKFNVSLVSKFLNSELEGNFVTSYGAEIAVKGLCSDGKLLTGYSVTLNEGETFEFSIACAFGPARKKIPGIIHELSDHISDYGAFFNGIPRLTCSDKKIETVYYYRWFLLRHHLSKPEAGNIRYPMVYEGRYGYFDESGEKSVVVGWEFSRGILASSSHHLLEMRWHTDLSLAKGIILNYTENFGKMEQFLGYTYSLPLLPGCIRVNDCKGHYFFHLLPFAAWLIYEMDGDRNFLLRVEPALRADLDGWDKFDSGNMQLPELVYEGDSAMEFGPASHCLDSSCDNEINLDLSIGSACSYESGGYKWSKPFSTRRTEVATFYALNYYAFANIYKALGRDGDAKYCIEKYSAIKKAVASRMWDNESGFFHELRADGSKIDAVKQIGGIFALLFLDPQNPEKFLNNLIDKNIFNQEYGIPSVSKDSFGYFPNNSVNGEIPHTCMWNGPIWPYAESLALLAVGSYVKRTDNSSVKKAYSEYFRDEFYKYTELHFLTHKGNKPCIVEHYNPETGAPLSGQDDYNHSSYIDLFIRMVVGFDPEYGKVNFSPINIGAESIKLDNIKFGNAVYSVMINGSYAALYKDGFLVDERNISYSYLTNKE